MLRNRSGTQLGEKKILKTASRFIEGYVVPQVDYYLFQSGHAWSRNSILYLTGT
ncbi:hypothetical protein BH09BAC4_BH09BAC4_24850 [soil metagenome]